MSQDKTVSRRDFMLKTRDAAVAATAITWLSSGHVSSALAYEPKLNSEAKAGKLLTAAQLKSLRAIAQTIIPKTDTPGAGDVDCHGFVDHQIVTCHPAPQQQQVVTIIKTIDKASMQLANTSFAELKADDQQTLLEKVEGLEGFSEQDKGDFKFLKQLIAFGYFTSQVGATQALTYLAVPGGYKGSIPADENTKSYGSLRGY